MLILHHAHLDFADHNRRQLRDIEIITGARLEDEANLSETEASTLKEIQTILYSTEVRLFNVRADNAALTSSAHSGRV